MIVVVDAPVCVYCRRRAVDPVWRPFCSERCKLLDLAAWADGSYRIPGPPPLSSEDGEPPPPDERD